MPTATQDLTLSLSTVQLSSMLLLMSPLLFLKSMGFRWKRHERLDNWLQTLITGKRLRILPGVWSVRLCGDKLTVEVRGIPHLAENERDLGHPLVRYLESARASSSAG
jgi:hypothetical protein